MQRYLEEKQFVESYQVCEWAIHPVTVSVTTGALSAALIYVLM